MSAQQATRDFEARGAAADVAAEATPRRRANGDGRLADALGWFSLGLGAAEVAAPGLLARLIGIEDSSDDCELLRAAGLREIASGVGILARDRRAGWVWARVGGDVMDLALLGSAYTSDEARRGRLAVATAAVAGVTALDVVCGRRLSNGSRSEESNHVMKAITVNRAADEVYAFWHDFENFPRFMEHIESVRVTAPKRSHWVAKGPAGTSFEWDSEIVEDRAGESIAWRSLKGADASSTADRSVSGARPADAAPRSCSTSGTCRLPTRWVRSSRRSSVRSPGSSGATTCGGSSCLPQRRTVSVAGVYGGFIDKFPIGAIVNRAPTIKSGQTHVQRYMQPLLERIVRGEIDPTYIITHRMTLGDAPEGYETFKNKEDECVKVVLKP